MFNFGGDTGLTYEALQRRRQIAEQLMQRGDDARPRYAVEGIGQGLSKIAGALMDRKLGKKEDAMRGEFNNNANSILFGGGGGYSSPASSYSAPTVTQNEALAAHGGPTIAAANAVGAPRVGANGWEGLEDVQAGIFAGESGGDYNALYGYRNRQPGAPQVSQMTVGEVIEFTMPNSPYAQSVKGEIGRVATPVGAYQVVGTTLREAVRALGIDPNEPFDQATQDKIGKWVLSTQGTGAWEGYRGPRQGGGGPSGGGGNSQARIAQLAEIAGSPMASESQRAVAQAMIEREMQASDPMRQMEMERERLEIERLRNPQPDLTSAQREYQMAVEQGYPGTFMDYQTGMKEAGRSSQSVTVQNTGPEPGRYLYAEEAGLPKGWRFDTETQRAERIPGGPDDVEAQEAAEGEANKDRQQALKLGTSLTSINLNIKEIEDGGLPVTGAVGDFRRTGLGRALTGSSAVDFGNRTNQVTDAAALGEIQYMRDNSPTGGAVGQLTDAERLAIGNSVTALNNSTSAEEYLRAAKAYRQLALDLAYGEGAWTLNDDGTVSFGGTPSARPENAGQASAISGMSMNDLLSVDLMTLSEAELDAWEARMRNLGAQNGG